MNRIFLTCIAFVFCAGLGAQPLLYPVKATGGVQYESSGWGFRPAMGGGGNIFHFGIDIACKTGTPIVAVDSGKVVLCNSKDPTFGRMMLLELESGYTVLYGHLSETWFARGSSVSRGQVIGLTGNTGQSTGPHLHFAILVNPALMLPSKKGGVE